jgi:FkbH-like protein
LTKWALYHQPYSSQFWIEIGEASSAVIASGYRPTPKCVVLDCDNTLWGGIIGEDGLGGIELNDTFPGSAFRVFQKRLVQLRAAGIMLAIASKNDISIVEEVFASHGEMILGKDDISCWKVNWLPKSENIREIASELNIGLDSLVFVDDSSFELAEVEMALPEVSLLQVPDELSELPSVIADSGLFRHISVSDEDRERTQMMLAESSRKKVQSTLSGEAFLQSLELEVEVFSLREEHIARVAQLTNKTNQFNLTTVRRSESEIAALMESEVFEVRAVRVADRFGDYGVVGVAVIERMKDGWLIDSFLLSCRVLGRGVESAFLSALVEEAKSDGIELVEGRYNPTVKNGQVATFYQDHGFLIKDGVFENLYSGELTVPTHVALKR